ncbi:MAG: hypothetical protein ACTSUE_26825 [Promethearchaeota archaeon]
MTGEYLNEYYAVTLELVEKGKVNAKLLRGPAPLTIQAMYKVMLDKFIAGRARWIDFTKKDSLYFGINVKRGKEGIPTTLKKGEFGYSYKLDAIIIALVDNPDVPYDVVRMGIIDDDLGIFNDMMNGTSIKMKLTRK